MGDSLRPATGNFAGLGSEHGAPHPRVAISVPVVGGAGGAERYVQSVVRALRDWDIDVFAARRAGGVDETELAANAHIVGPARWRPVGPRAPFNDRLNRLMNAARRSVNGTYDAVLRIGGGPDLEGRVFRARDRFVVPAGNAVSVRAGETVLLEAPDNARMIDPATRVATLPPPYFPIADRSEPVGEVPADFLLTIMNPYSEVKGLDVLEEVARNLASPLVWCFSRRSFPGSDWRIPTLPNVVLVEDAAPAQLRWLYERCLAYVSFSKSEGFGWAIADALHHGCTVVSRRVGVLSFAEFVDDPGVLTYSSSAELLQLLRSLTRRHEPHHRGSTTLSSDRFRWELGALIGAQTDPPR